MNAQFDVVLVFVLIFVLNFLTMRVMIAEHLPYGIRAILGAAGIVVTIVLAEIIATYGR